MDEKKIQKTKDYDRFKRIVGNRKIYKKHLQSLIVAIEEDNRLSSVPILINRNWEIIDGQHRLEAARALSVPIYYIVEDNANVDDVKLLNSVVRKWSLTDYIDSFAQRGFTDYITLQSFMKRHGTPPGISILMLSEDFVNRHTEGELGAKFKKGLFKVADLARAEAFVSEVRTWESYFEIKTQIFNEEFVIALARTLDKIDNKTLHARMKMSGNITVPMYANASDFLRFFESIINWRKQSENHIRLF